MNLIDRPGKCYVCGRVLDPELEYAKCRGCSRLWSEPESDREAQPEPMPERDWRQERPPYAR